MGTSFRCGFCCAAAWVLSVGWGRGGEAMNIEVLAHLQPYRSIEIAAVESGFIEEILVAEGDIVTKGEVLLRLDTGVIRARLAVAKANAQAKGQLMSAKGKLDYEKEHFRRLANLRGKNSFSQSEYNKQAATVAQAEGDYLIAQERQKAYQLEVAQIEAELRRRTLTSPINGTVVEITQDVNESVMSKAEGRDYQVRVVRLDRLKCVGHIPSQASSRLAVGDELRVRVEDGEPVDVEGVIEYVSPVVNFATGTVVAHLVIENPEEKLRGGATAYILVPLP